jgi:hypothetical protein
VADHKKPRAKRVSPKRARNVFARLDCEVASYNFDVGSDVFDLGKFYEETGLKAEHGSWSTVFYARNQRSGYHVHFDGKVKGNNIDLTVAYYVGSVTRPTKGPFPETAMEWVGSFFRKATERAWINSRFSKSDANWRSRFNLPFKVTMSGSKAEVIIDGISLDLPPNASGAMHAWLTKFPKHLMAAVMLRRPITFAAFKIEKELPEYNEALRIFVEEFK